MVFFRIIDLRFHVSPANLHGVYLVGADAARQKFPFGLARYRIPNARPYCA